MKTETTIQASGMECGLLSYLDQFNPDDLAAARNKIYEEFMEKIERDIQSMMGIPSSMVRDFELHPIYSPEPYRYNPYMDGTVKMDVLSFVSLCVTDCEGALLTRRNQEKLDSAVTNRRRAEHAGNRRRAGYWINVANKLLRA